MGQIKIRRGTIKDREAAREIWKELVQYHLGELGISGFDHRQDAPNEFLKQWEKFVRSRNRLALIAELDGEVAGMLMGAIERSHPYMKERRFANVEELAVSSRHRRRGVGEALMDGFFAWARGMGVAQCSLMVAKGNAPALGLYEKLGFETTIHIQRKML